MSSQGRPDPGPPAPEPGVIINQLIGAWRWGKEFTKRQGQYPVTLCAGGKPRCTLHMVQLEWTAGEPESWILLAEFQALVVKNFRGPDNRPRRYMSRDVCRAVLADMESETASYLRICSIGAFPLPGEFQHEWAETVAQFEALVEEMVRTAEAQLAAEAPEQRFVHGPRVDDLIAEFLVGEAGARSTRQDLIDAVRRQGDKFRARAAALDE
jgi:hypothetical protein